MYTSGWWTNSLHGVPRLNVYDEVHYCQYPSIEHQVWSIQVILRRKLSAINSASLPMMRILLPWPLRLTQSAEFDNIVGTDQQLTLTRMKSKEIVFVDTKRKRQAAANSPLNGIVKVTSMKVLGVTVSQSASGRPWSWRLQQLLTDSMCWDACALTACVIRPCHALHRHRSVTLLWVTKDCHSRCQELFAIHSCAQVTLLFYGSIYSLVIIAGAHAGTPAIA